MIALLLVLAAQEFIEEDAGNEAADWQCASPLVERNYSQSVDARQLARRIHDECALGYVPINDPYGTLQTTHHTIYLTKSLVFLNEIELEILRLRRRDEIPLR